MHCYERRKRRTRITLVAMNGSNITSENAYGWYYRGNMRGTRFFGTVRGFIFDLIKGDEGTPKDRLFITVTAVLQTRISIVN